jgi:hypothetical protein
MVHIVAYWQQKITRMRTSGIWEQQITRMRTLYIWQKQTTSMRTLGIWQQHITRMRTLGIWQQQTTRMRKSGIWQKQITRMRTVDITDGIYFCRTIITCCSRFYVLTAVTKMIIDLQDVTLCLNAGLKGGGGCRAN